MEYTPHSPSSGFLRMAINTDLKLKLPMIILEPVTSNFGVDFYKNIRKVAKNFHKSEWEAKMK